MCHDHDSRPPAPPGREVGERGVLTLTAADGTELSAAYAAPAATPGVGVVVLPDVRGLHPYYVALAERFAETGAARSPSTTSAGRRGCDEHGHPRPRTSTGRPTSPQTTAEGIDADIAAAVAYLRARTRPDLPVVTVGFCFGGSHSWRQSERRPRPRRVRRLLRPAGGGGRGRRAGAPADRDAHRRRRQGHAGGGPARRWPRRCARPVRTSTTVVYDGAPHSFFDRAVRPTGRRPAPTPGEHVLALTDRVARR